MITFTTYHFMHILFVFPLHLSQALVNFICKIQWCHTC